MNSRVNSVRYPHPLYVCKAGRSTTAPPLYRCISNAKNRCKYKPAAVLSYVMILASSFPIKVPNSSNLLSRLYCRHILLNLTCSVGLNQLFQLADTLLHPFSVVRITHKLTPQILLHHNPSGYDILLL